MDINPFGFFPGVTLTVDADNAQERIRGLIRSIEREQAEMEMANGSKKLPVWPPIVQAKKRTERLDRDLLDRAVIALGEDV